MIILNRLMMDSLSSPTRLAERLGGTACSNGHGGTRRFGMRLPEAAAL